MNIESYFDDIKAVLDRYSKARFVINIKVSFDIRPGEQGYLNGVVYFVDDSSLHFKEFLDYFHGRLDKLMYSYHYQDADNKLRLRYDNAQHKLPLDFIMSLKR